MSELLRIKAKVIAECQTLIRRNLYPNAEHDGILMRNPEDEKGFIIEPLLEANPVEDNVHTKIQAHIKLNKSSCDDFENSVLLEPSI